MDQNIRLLACIFNEGDEGSEPVVKAGPEVQNETNIIEERIGSEECVGREE